MKYKNFIKIYTIESLYNFKNGSRLLNFKNYPRTVYMSTSIIISRPLGLKSKN